MTKNFRDVKVTIMMGAKKKKLLSQLWWAALFLQAEKELISGSGALSHKYHVPLQVI